MRAALLALAALCSPVSAADTWLTVSVASYHFDRSSKKYNELNPGLGIEHALTPALRLMGGYYRNSFYRDTVYAGAAYLPLKVAAFRGGFAVAAISGYSSDYAVLPFIVYEGKSFGVNVMFAPPMKGHDGAAGLQLKWPLN